MNGDLESKSKMNYTQYNFVVCCKKEKDRKSNTNACNFFQIDDAEVLLVLDGLFDIDIMMMHKPYVGYPVTPGYNLQSKLEIASPITHHPSPIKRRDTHFLVLVELG